MWNVEKLVTISKTRTFVIVVSSVVAAASGAVGGYYFAKNRLEKKFEERLDREIEATKAFYSQLNKTGEFADLGAMAEKYKHDKSNDDLMDETDVTEAAEILVSEGYTSYNKAAAKEADMETVDVRESIKQNVFDTKIPEEDVPEFDEQLELVKKGRGEPYILTSKEFFENDSMYKQRTMTYFSGDDVLMFDDEEDKPINDVKRIIGEDNLRFGYGSDDRLVVFVRNDQMQEEFEITLTRGKYSIEVLGELEHAFSNHRIRKFREE